MFPELWLIFNAEARTRASALKFSHGLGIAVDLLE